MLNSLTRHDRRPDINRGVPNGSARLTSATLDGAVLPAAVGPDVEVLRVPLVLPPAPVPGHVDRHRVLVVDPVRLVVEQQHLEEGDMIR